MKRIVALIFLVFNFSYGQDLPLGVTPQQKKDFLYVIRISNLRLDVTKTEEGLCNNELSISSIDNKGKEEGIHWSNNIRRYQMFADDNYFRKSEIISLHCRAISTDRRRHWFSWKCDQNARIQKRTGFIEKCKVHHFLERGEHPQNEVRNQLSFAYQLLPLHTLTPEIFNNLPNTYLPIGTKVKLLAKEGFSTELYNYEVATKRDSVLVPMKDGNIIRGYRYKFTPRWEKLSPSFKKGNGEYISISAEDIFGSEAEARKNIGKTVYFRVVSYDKDTGSVCSSSETVELKVTISAPKIKVKTEQPQCPNNKGKVTITFDRELEATETLSFSIVQGTYSQGKFTQDMGTTPLVSYDTKQTRELLKNKTITLNNVEPLDDSKVYRIQFVGHYQYGSETISTYSDGEDYQDTFQIIKIPEITATSTITNNLCYGEKNGSIRVTVSGGTAPYKYIKEGTTDEIPFTDKSFTINSLAAGTYKFHIKDSRNCSMQGEVTATITEPTPIEIVNENIAEEDANGNENPRAFKTDVSGFGLKNGKIRAEITNGTPFKNPSTPYQVVLTTERGGVIAPATSPQPNAQNHFVAEYHQLDKGTYTLTITDGNGCKITRSITITEPNPLIVTLSETKPISCNRANDESSSYPNLIKDGEIEARVEGGVPFNDGTYKYTWYRMEGGVRQVIPSDNEKTIKELSEGVYQVDIEDKKRNKTTGTITLKFPERLSLTTEGSEISCSAPTSGTAKANPKGGTPPYTYQWSDGQTTQTATGLSAGKYFVVVTDSKGCFVQAQVVLSYPNAASIDKEQITHPTCYGDKNGSISVETSGGKGRVMHTWYDASGNIITQGISQNGKTIKNLSAGTYKIVLRDEGDCPAIEKTFEIVQPQKLQLSIEREITLCQGDSYTFDLEGQIPNATYRWTDASGSLLGSGATFVVHSAGDYYVEATDLSGCKTSEKIVVKQSSQVLDVDFLVATTSYYDYTLKLINLSKKTDALQWQFPSDVIIVQQDDQQAEVRFSKEGMYKVGLKGTLGDCNKVIYKTLFVEKDRIGIQKDPVVQKNIESFLIVPNPNSGTYQLHIKLSKSTAIRVRLIDMLGRELFAPEDFPAQSEFVLPFNKSNLSAGQYIILLEAGNDVLSQKMIVK